MLFLSFIFILDCVSTTVVKYSECDEQADHICGDILATNFFTRSVASDAGDVGSVCTVKMEGRDPRGSFAPYRIFYYLHCRLRAHIRMMFRLSIIGAPAHSPQSQTSSTCHMKHGLAQFHCLITPKAWAVVKGVPKSYMSAFSNECFTKMTKTSCTLGRSIICKKIEITR